MGTNIKKKSHSDEFRQPDPKKDPGMFPSPENISRELQHLEDEVRRRKAELVMAMEQRDRLQQKLDKLSAEEKPL